MIRTLNILTLLFLTSTLVFGHGDVHVRIDIVSEAIAVEPDDVGLIVKRASLYTEDGDFKHALIDLKVAEKMAGNQFGPMLLAYSELYRELGQYKVALKYIDRFLDNNERHVIGLKTKAEILTLYGKPELAIPYLEQVIEYTTTLLPENYLELIDQLTVIRKFDEAIAYCYDALLEFGDLIVIELKLLELEKGQKHYDVALELLDRMMARQERKENWYYRKAEVYILMEEYDLASRHLVQADEAIRRLPERLKQTRAMQRLLTDINILKNDINPPNNDQETQANVNTE